MVTNSVAWISPLLQGRNGYLLSIGRKGRFLVVKCSKNGQKEKQNRKRKNGWKPLCKHYKGLAPGTCKQHVRNQNSCKTSQVINLQINHGLESKLPTKTNIENDKLYLLFGWNGPPCPSLEKHLSWMGELWLNGGWRRGSVGGLRHKGSQGIHGQHNSMQGRSVLRVTPTPLFIAFLGLFRVLSPWLGLQPLFWDFSSFCPIFSSFWGFKLL